MRVPFREIGSRFMLELVSRHEPNPVCLQAPPSHSVESRVEDRAIRAFGRLRSQAKLG
jgi:hypothetical protein